MKGQKSATAAEKRRYDILSSLGCVVCRRHHAAYRDAEIHHLTEGFKRLGNRHTIPLCAWHHRAIPDYMETRKSMTQVLGPSLAISRQSFKAAFGGERELLRYVNGIIHRTRQQLLTVENA